MLSSHTLDVVETFWAEFLGCKPQDFRGKGSRIVEHGSQLADYSGAYIFIRNGAVIVSLPGSMLKTFTDVTRHWRFAPPYDRASLAEYFKVEEKYVIGPASVAYADHGTLRLIDSSARLLSFEDEPAVAGLKAQCGEEEWAHGGSAMSDKSAGIFANRSLLALSSYEIWGAFIAHISIITAPSRRGTGLARNAVSFLAKHALDSGLTPQYRTLRSNVASMRVAAALGFVPLAVTLAVRLGSPITDP
jgi:GNAT superfamily N-acetyltransferase